MDEEKIRAKLNQLRESRHPDIAEFAKKAGLYDSNVRQVDRGVSLPAVPRIEKWVNACGLTLSQFFAELEAEERGVRPDPHEELVQRFRSSVLRDPEAAEIALTLLERVGVKRTVKPAPVRKPARSTPARKP